MRSLWLLKQCNFDCWCWTLILLIFSVSICGEIVTKSFVICILICDLNSKCWLTQEGYYFELSLNPAHDILCTCYDHEILITHGKYFCSNAKGTSTYTQLSILRINIPSGLKIRGESLITSSSRIRGINPFLPVPIVPVPSRLNIKDLIYLPGSMSFLDTGGIILAAMPHLFRSSFLYVMVDDHKDTSTVDKSNDDQTKR